MSRRLVLGVLILLVAACASRPPDESSYMNRIAADHSFFGVMFPTDASFQDTLNCRIVSDFGSMIWTAQAMQGSKEWIVRRISSG